MKSTQTRTEIRLAILLCITFLLVGLPAFANENHSAKGHSSSAHDEMATKNIVETAVAAGSFTTLAKALTAAGLSEALQGEGPFTVFAPTDEAFAKLPAGTLDGLLADKAKLEAVLTYHVVPGKVLAADVMSMKSAKTLEGSTIKIKSSKNGVKVNDANVVKTDILASNGVIHVIDAVILPPM